MENSEKILLFINSKNISLYKLSKETCISESTFSKWKSNPTSKIDLSIVQKIAEYFNVSIDNLLDLNQLSDDENNLIESYRLLSPQGKEYIKQQIFIASEIFKKQDICSDTKTG